MRSFRISTIITILFGVTAIFSISLFNFNGLPLKRMNFLVVVVFSSLFALILFWAIIHLLARKTLRRGMKDFIIGDQGGYSLSRLQAVMWAIVIMGSQFAIMFSIWLGHGFDSIYLYQPVFSESALWLLGLSLTSCLTVKGITVERIRSGKDYIHIKDKPRVSDIIMGANGLDFSKCQMLIWTLVGLSVYSFNTYNFIYAVAECNGISAIPALLDNQYNGTLTDHIDKCKPFVPYLAWSFVVLMGLSQGAYIGKKLLPQGLTPESPVTVSDFSSNDETPEGIVKQAIIEHSTTWMKEYDVQVISPGKKPLSNNKVVNCIVFQPVKKLDPGVLPNGKFIPPVIVYYSVLHQKEYNIPTDVQPVNSIVRSSAEHNAACHGFWPKKPGCSVSRTNAADTGTIGAKVFRGTEAYLLGCYHVLCAPELNREQFVLRDYSANPGRSIISPGKIDSGVAGDKIGQAVEGYIDGFTDCAIARLSDSLLLSEKPWSHVNATPVARELTDADVAASVLLSIYGRTSGFRAGRLKFLHSDSYVEYKINNESRFIKLSGLIQTHRLSSDGDSGAPVYDPKGFIIGIVVATADADSFIIPIKRVLSYLNVTLKPTT